MAEVGLWARTREMTGTVRTLAGSVRCDVPHYTGIDDFEQVNRTCRGGVYLMAALLS